MENILKKREQKLIKEGLFIIDSFEKYTSKNNPDIYKKYLDIKDEKFIDSSSNWMRYKRALHNAKFYNKDEINIKMYDDMFKEINNYITTLKPEVFLDREDLDKINDNIYIINKISKLPDQSRLNYNLKCNTFLKIKSYLIN